MKQNNFIFFFVLFMTIFSANSQAGQEFKKNFSLPQANLKKQVLDNGLVVLLQENHKQPLVGIELLVKTGSIYEENYLGCGVAHLTEHMLFKGTAKRPPGKVEEEVNNMGGTINGYTSHQFTGYTLTLPANFLEEGLDILKDLASNPLFDEQELIKEKTVILSEIKLTRDDPQRYLNQLFWMQAYPQAPYNLPVIGLEPLFNKLTRDDVLNFYRKWYVPNNMIISIAGDISEKKTMESVKNAFLAMELKPFPQVFLTPVSFFKQPKYYAQEYDTNATYMMLGFPGVNLSNSDAASLDVLAIILGQGQSSILNKILLKQKKLLFSVNAENYTPNFMGIFIISCLLDEKNTAPVKEEIRKEIKKLSLNPVGKEELEKAKNSFLNDYVFNQQTVQSQAQSAASDEAYTGNPDFSRHYIETIAKITPQDIKECAKKYLDTDNYLQLVLKPKSGSAKKEEKTTPQKDESVKKIVLDNGLRLLYKKDTVSSASSIQIVFSGATRYENEKNNGVFNMLSEMLLKGTKTRTSQAIAQDIEQIGANISAFSGYNSFGITLNLMSKDILRGLEIFSDLILNPVFPEDELSLEKDLTLQTIKMQNDDIFQDTARLLRENLFIKYPYRYYTFGNEAAVKQIDKKMLSRYYSDFCRPNNAVLFIAADLEENRIKEIVNGYFSKWKPKTAPQIKFEAEPVKQKQTIVKNQRDKEQAILMLGFPGVNIKNNDRYAIDFLNAILTAPGSVLYNRIREKAGFSYTLGGSFVSGLDTGYFFIYVATKPESLSEVKRIVVEEIENIKASLIEENSILTARNHMIGQHRISLQANSAIGFTCALDELYGLGFDYHLKYEDLINSLDAKTLQKAAQIYFDFNKSVIVITGKELDV